MTQYNDISNELCILPYKNGIKLAKPVVSSNPGERSSVANVLSQPCNTYFLNLDNKLVNGNHACATALGFDCVSESIGRAISERMLPMNAAALHENNSIVLQTNKAKIVEEIIFHDNAPSQHYLSIKMPWYNHNDKAVGIFGFGILLGVHPLEAPLNFITKAGLLQMLQPPVSMLSQLKSYHCSELPQLTPRQLQVLDLILQGKICPEISLQLCLSKRTVEHYISSIKNKFNVQSKSELIEKVLHIKQNYYLSP